MVNLHRLTSVDGDASRAHARTVVVGQGAVGNIGGAALVQEHADPAVVHKVGGVGGDQGLTLVYLSA